MTEEMPKCPFCESPLSYRYNEDMLRQYFGDEDDGLKHYHSILHCNYCMTVMDANHAIDPSLSQDKVDELIRSAAIALAEQRIANIKESDAYRLFKSDCEEYEQSHNGHEMPLWYGICTDYMMMGKSEYAPNDHIELLKNRDDLIERDLTASKKAIQEWNIVEDKKYGLKIKMRDDYIKQSKEKGKK